MDEPAAAFFERVSRLADAGPVEELVIDARANGGGNFRLIRPPPHWILRVDNANAPRRTFTVVGRPTFSAPSASSI